MVVPLSTLANWSKELKKWGAGMNVITYQGKKANRDKIRECEFDRSDGRFGFNVLLTTYETVTTDADVLGEISWKCLLVDEAHRLKNHASQWHETLKNFNHRHRVLITGTPLQVGISSRVSALVAAIPLSRQALY